MGSFELPEVGVGKPAQVLWKIKRCVPFLQPLEMIFISPV